MSIAGMFGMVTRGEQWGDRTRTQRRIDRAKKEKIRKALYWKTHGRKK